MIAATLERVAAVTDTFDLGRLKLSSGEGRRLELHTAIEPFDYGGQSYAVEPSLVPVRLDVSRTTGSGWALRLRFTASVKGPCMRCLEPAELRQEVDAREVDAPGGGEELDSPYVDDQVLDVAGWARDALALALGGEQVLCTPDCAGLCAVCGEKLAPGEEHEHERAPDPRWAKLRELKLD